MIRRGLTIPVMTFSAVPWTLIVPLYTPPIALYALILPEIVLTAVLPDLVSQFRGAARLRGLV